MLEIIKNYHSPSLEERETIITYDDETKLFHVYADTPKYARKFEKLLDESKPCKKGYSESGILVFLEGYMVEDARISLRQKRKISEEERARMAELAKKRFGK